MPRVKNIEGVVTSITNKPGLEGFSDESIFECACPGIVAFCKEYQANNARNCVIEFMEIVEEDQYRADKLGLTWEQYHALSWDELDAMIAGRLEITVEQYRTLPDDEIDRLAVPWSIPIIKNFDMSNILFCSDTHFYHEKVILYSNRPYADVHEMNEAFIKNWNEVVQPNDIVWHLGDVAFCSYEKLVNLRRRLNGQINLVLGNHDKMIIKNSDKLLKAGVFNSIQHYARIDYEKQTIILFHYACRTWDKRHFGAWLLFGHSHSTLPPLGKSVDVGVDSKEITSEYRPVSIEEVSRYMAKRPMYEPSDAKNEQHRLRAVDG